MQPTSDLYLNTAVCVTMTQLSKMFLAWSNYHNITV